jgi:ketosteroid isomerase-like protein
MGSGFSAQPALVITPRGPSSPAWQRFYIALAGIPGLPELSWRLVPKGRSVLLQAMRVVRCAFDCFNRTGSLPAAVFDRDAVTNQAAEVLGTVGTFHGHQGWLELMEEVREAFDAVRLEPERLVGVAPDRMVVFVRLSARGRGSGLSVDTQIAIVVTIRRGRAGRLDIYRDPADAVAAAGLPPTAGSPPAA